MLISYLVVKDRLLTLSMATLVRPKVLLLDEHTAALDPKTSDMVMNLTKSSRRAEANNPHGHS